MCHRQTHLFLCRHYYTDDFLCGKPCPRVGGIYLKLCWVPHYNACGGLQNCKLSVIEMILDGRVAFSQWNTNFAFGKNCCSGGSGQAEEENKSTALVPGSASGNEELRKTYEEYRQRLQWEEKKWEEKNEAYKTDETLRLDAPPPALASASPQTGGAGHSAAMVPYQSQHQQAAGQLVGYDASQYPSYYQGQHQQAAGQLVGYDPSQHPSQYPSQYQGHQYQSQLSGYPDHYPSQDQQYTHQDPYPYHQYDQYSQLLPSYSTGYLGPHGLRVELYDGRPDVAGPGVAGLLPPPEAPSSSGSKDRPERGDKTEKNEMKRKHQDEKGYGKQGGKEKKQRRHR